MAETGPGILQSWVVNTANTIVVDDIEGFADPGERGEYTSARQENVRRGIIKRHTGTINNYTHFTALETLMTARTAVPSVLNYFGGTDTLTDGKVIVIPVIAPVPDQAELLIGAVGTNPADATSLGLLLEPTTIEGSVNDHTDRYGLPYFSWCNISGEFLLPDAAAANITEGRADVFVRRPDGNFDAFRDVRVHKQYAEGDANRPKAVQLNMSGTNTTWGALVTYVDGTSGQQTRAALFDAFTLQVSGYGRQESDVLTRA